MGDPSNEGNLKFAFNDEDFSNRVLRIEIMADRVHDGGDGVARINELECSTIIKVETFHINSLILASKSPFFYKLFKNGMRESQQRDVTLRISASEEASLMDLLHYMYGNTLSSTTTLELLDVLMISDKFEVISCMNYCIQLLLKLPISPKTALLYLELPSSVVMGRIVQPLIDATKRYLVTFYKDFTKCREKLMSLPLSTIEVVIGSDTLQVDSEDAIFDFILEWACAHYPEQEERQEILNEHLIQFIRFQYMTSMKLKSVLTYPEFDNEEVYSLVIEALYFKVEAQHSHALIDRATTKCNNVERVYKYRPIKVVQFKLAWPQCAIYFDLKKEDCANLFRSREVLSEPVLLGGRRFFLLPQCNKDQQDSLYHFGLFLTMEKNSVSCMLSYEFAALKKPSVKFRSKYCVENCILDGGAFVGTRDMFKIPWNTFMSNDSKYFIDGILHLRVYLTVKSY